MAAKTDRTPGPEQAAESEVAVQHSGDVLVLTRSFAAPPERVFAAWTEAPHFARWFGPKGATVPHCTVDLRAGGVMHFCVQEPGGEKVWGKWVFREVRKPHKIVFVDSFSDEAGDVVERPGFPREMVITVTFEAHERGTLVTVRHEGLVVDHGEVQGWKEGFERLDEHLKEWQ